MLYAIFQLHPETYNLSFLGIHRDYRTAKLAFASEVNNYIRNTLYSGGQGADPTVITRKKQITVPGYYLKTSNRHSDRLKLYEKVSDSVPGRWWGSNETSRIVKQRLFSIVPIDTEGNTAELTPHSWGEQQKKQSSKTLQQHGGHVKYLGELKERLASNRLRALAKNSSVTAPMTAPVRVPEPVSDVSAPLPPEPLADPDYWTIITSTGQGTSSMTLPPLPDDLDSHMSDLSE